MGGAIWNFFGGIRNAPSGSRLQQAFARVSARTPILGGKLRALMTDSRSTFDSLLDAYLLVNDCSLQKLPIIDMVFFTELL